MKRLADVLLVCAAAHTMSAIWHAPGRWMVGLLLGVALLGGGNANAVDIGAEASKVEFIDFNDLASGAGSDLVDPLQGQSPFTLVITNAVGITYAISVRKAPGYNLPGSITLKVRKASGGFEEIVVGDTDTEFFQATGNDRHPVALVLENASIAVLPPNSYNADLVFSVAEVP